MAHVVSQIVHSVQLHVWLKWLQQSKASGPAVQLLTTVNYSDKKTIVSSTLCVKAAGMWVIIFKEITYINKRLWQP